MDKKEYLRQLSQDFGVQIHGLLEAEKDFNDLKNKWLLVFKGKTRKEFYENVLPKLERAKEKFNKEIKKILNDVIEVADAVVPNPEVRNLNHRSKDANP